LQSTKTIIPSTCRNLRRTGIQYGRNSGLTNEEDCNIWYTLGRISTRRRYSGVDMKLTTVLRKMKRKKKIQ
jgi:hypothetical protein